VATERDHHGRSIVRGMLDLDDVSPNGYNVQGLRHSGTPCASFQPKEPPPVTVEARYAESIHTRAPTSNSCISASIENLTHVYMNLFHTPTS
jgi:hypothetical protein